MSSNKFFGGLLCLLSMGFTATQSQAETVYVVTTGNQLARFDSLTPNNVQSQIPVTGLQGGESLVGLDYRITDQQLYAVTNQDRLYTINYTTGAATAVGTGFLPPAAGSSVGFDFNPRVDLLRLITDQEENYRINPNTGVTTAQDTALTYSLSDSNVGADPNVTAAAYTRNAGLETSTTLYGIDTNLDVLVRIGGLDGPPSPNGGSLTTVGPLGVNTNDLATLDVSPTEVGGLTAVATLTAPGASKSSAYLIDLTSGTATLIDEINISERVTGMTLVPDTDGDGIPDSQDQCPDTTTGTVVGPDGCSTASIAQANLTGVWVNLTEKCKTNKKGVTKCNTNSQFLVVNNGNTDAAPTTVNFYVSSDATFDQADVPFASKNVKLKAGKLKKLKAKFKSNQAVFAGQYVIAVIDRTQLVPESDETDNTVVYGPEPF